MGGIINGIETVIFLKNVDLIFLKLLPYFLLRANQNLNTRIPISFATIFRWLLCETQ